MARQALPRLTSLRWYAAMVVFLFHLGSFIDWRPLRAFSFGEVGVTFFFVLSGFVLAWSTPSDLAPRTFYRRRLARIYPSYVVALAFGVFVALAWPESPIDKNLLAVPASLLLLQSWVPAHAGGFPYSFNPPLWSLSCEAFFYAAFPFLAYGLRRLSPRAKSQSGLLIILSALVVGEYLSYHGLSQVAMDNPVERLAEFLFGMVLAMRVQDGWRPKLPIWFAVGLVVVACWLARSTVSGAGLFSYVPFPFEDYLVAFPTGLLLVTAATADLHGCRGLMTKRTSVYLGEVSFAFYLVHYLVTRVLIVLLSWGHPWGGLTGLLPLTVTFSSSLCLAIALHHIVELPMQQLLRDRRARSGGKADVVSYARA